MAQDTGELFLRVILNGADTGELAPMTNTPSGLRASAATLRRIGLAVDADDSTPVELATLPQLQVQYEPGLQLLRLTAPVRLLARSTTVVRAASGPEGPLARDPAPSAVLFNYSMYGERAGPGWSIAAWNEVRTLGWLPGVLSQSFLARAASADRRQAPFLRLDSTWRADDPARLLSVEAGDTVTSALPWMRRTRIAGLAVRRDLALQPYLPMAPAPAISGEAVLPSTVELFMDGVRQSVSQVPAGRFQVDAAPRLNGRGQAELKVTDILGQVRTTSIDFYGAPGLLRQGVADGAVEAGFIRRHYGSASDSYGKPMLNAIARYGITDGITFAGMAQSADHLSAIGGGAELLVGSSGGVVTAAGALSHRGDALGRQGVLGYSWFGRDFSLAAYSTVRNRYYAEAGDLDGSASFRRRDSLFLGGRVRAAQVGLGYVRQVDAAGTRSSISANAALALSARTSLSLAFSKESGRGGSATLQMIVALDGRRTVASGVRHRGGETESWVDASRPAEFDGGNWGWRARAAATASSASGEIQVSHGNEQWQWAGGLATSGRSGPPAAQASASGSLLLLGSGAYAMRQSPDAFAVVSTDGVANVPVRLENRAVGRTDENGRLLVTGLLSNQKNRLTIDPLEIPLGFRADGTERAAVPATRSGALVSFRLRPVHPLHATVRDGDGRPLPAGTVGTVRPARPDFTGEPQEVVVGYEGEIYVEDFAEDAVLSFGPPAAACRIDLEHHLPSDPLQWKSLSCPK